MKSMRRVTSPRVPCQCPAFETSECQCARRVGMRGFGVAPLEASPGARVPFKIMLIAQGVAKSIPTVKQGSPARIATPTGLAG